MRRFQEQQASAEYPDLVSELDLVTADPELPGLRWNDRPIASSRSRSPAPGTAANLLRGVGRAAVGVDPLGPLEPAGLTSGDLRDWRFDPDLPACFVQFRPSSLFDRARPAA